MAGSSTSVSGWLPARSLGRKAVVRSCVVLNGSYSAWPIFKIPGSVIPGSIFRTIRVRQRRIRFGRYCWPLINWRAFATSVDHYTYRVTWSPDDGEYLGLCTEFPSLSWLAATPKGALKGIRQVVSDVLADMNVPVPLAEKRYSGEFRVRTPPELLRALAMQAAEQKVGRNRRVSAKLAILPIGLTNEFATDVSRQAMWHAFLKKNEITITPHSEVVAKLRLILEPALVQAATFLVTADLVDVDKQVASSAWISNRSN
jgi:hypothetical protein